ncbi:DUF3592 domain-containing protein [Pilimelia columellifera]|uniref:DUF3592 domain-containing protein n=1 Tax=Pilimelia columellifera subsp. columellifera TaxID=706583 RepID=A0ABP6B2P2_9ACTN
MTSFGAVADRGLLVFGCFSLIPLATGAFMIVKGHRQRRQASRLAFTGRRTTATIVDNQMQPMSEGRMLFHPVIRFAAGDRKVVTAVPNPSPRSYVTGTTMEVAYDPADPRLVAPVDGTAGRGYLTGGLIFIGFAVVIAVVSLLIFEDAAAFDTFGDVPADAELPDGFDPGAVPDGIDGE